VSRRVARCSGCMAAAKASVGPGRRVPSWVRPPRPLLTTELPGRPAGREEFAEGRGLQTLLPRSKGPPAAGPLPQPIPTPVRGWDSIFQTQQGRLPASQPASTAQQTVPPFLLQNLVKKLRPPPLGIKIAWVFVVLLLAGPAASQGMRLWRGPCG